MGETIVDGEHAVTPQDEECGRELEELLKRMYAFGEGRLAVMG
jgi:hypothetical protein